MQYFLFKDDEYLNTKFLKLKICLLINDIRFLCQCVSGTFSIAVLSYLNMNTEILFMRLVNKNYIIKNNNKK